MLSTPLNNPTVSIHIHSEGSVAEHICILLTKPDSMASSSAPPDETPSSESESGPESEPDSTDGSVTIVGTAHVSPDSLDELRGTIEQEEPDVVAVELCGRRYIGDIPDNAPYAGDDTTPGIRTLLFLPLMQYLQTRTAEERGLDPDTTDMGAAIDAAIDADSNLVLLDRDILTTFERYWEKASARETLRVVASIGLAIVRGDSTLLNTATPSRETDTDVVEEYRKTTEERFPMFRSVFLDERDELMAARLEDLQQAGYDTVAVVGAAHKPGIESALDDDLNIETISTPLLDPRPDIDHSM